jgi:hypothetical protein
MMGATVTLTAFEENDFVMFAKINSPNWNGMVADV